MADKDGQMTFDDFILDNKDDNDEEMLEQSEEISKNSDESYFNMDDAHVIYMSDKYDVILNGDLSSDIYLLTIEEVKEK